MVHMSGFCIDSFKGSHYKMVFLRLFVLCEDSLQPTLFTLFLSSLTYITILFTHFSRVSFCTSTDG